MTDKIIAAAREAGFVVQRDEWVLQTMLRTFYAIARTEALEDAAKVCDAKHDVRARDGFPREASTARALSKEIHALMKENTHG